MDDLRTVEESRTPPSSEIKAAEELGDALQIEQTAKADAVDPRYPLVGTTVTNLEHRNHYNILGVLGQGFFATVYAATDEWDNELAVKVISPNLTRTTDQVREAGKREMARLLHIRHPYITFVVDAFELEENYFIVTERCALTVDSLYENDWLVGSGWIMPLARCLLQAINFAHFAGVVHQDVHGKNVYVHFHRNEFGEQEQPSLSFKLGDFGIAKLVNEVSANNTRQMGGMLLPEILDPGRNGLVNHQADIYHCGLLFLQLALNRQLTFSPDEITRGLPRELAEGLTSPYRNAIARSLRRRVSERTPTARDLWRDLRSTVQLAPDPPLSSAPIDGR